MAENDTNFENDTTPERVTPDVKEQGGGSTPFEMAAAKVRKFPQSPGVSKFLNSLKGSGLLNK